MSQNKSKEQQPKNQPLETFRAGQIKATVWKNTRKNTDGEKFDVLSATVVKSYKDGDEWKDTTSFNANDLPKLALVAQEAYAFIVMHKENTESDGDDE